MLMRIRGFAMHGFKLVVDEIWLYPAPTPPVLPPPAPSVALLNRPPSPPPVLDSRGGQPARRTLLQHPEGDFEDSRSEEPWSTGFRDSRTLPKAPAAPAGLNSNQLVPQETLEKLQRIFSSKSHGELLSSMMDEELKALSEVVSANMGRLQTAMPPLSASALASLFGNVQVRSG